MEVGQAADISLSQPKSGLDHGGDAVMIKLILFLLTGKLETAEKKDVTCMCKLY